MMVKNLYKTHLLTSLASFAAMVLASQNDTTYCKPHKASLHDQKLLFQGWVHDFYIARNIPQAFHLYIAQDFVQHNPYEAPYGALPSQIYLTGLFGNISYGVEVLHQGFDHGIGWVHWRLDYYDPRPVVTADIFRFNGSCIQEHWDVIQELPQDATNPIALF